MEILIAVLMGALVGWFSALCQRGERRVRANVAIGTLGALLGAAAAAWLRGFSQPTYVDGLVASVVGGGLLLVLWNVALRLFLLPPADPIGRN